MTPAVGRPDLHSAADARAQVQAARMYEADTASQALGITVRDVAPGMATATMLTTPTMANGHGIVHGGYLFLLADTAFAFACNTHGPDAVARHCDITFVRPVAAGEELTAVATEHYRDTRNGIYDVTVRDASSEPVAEMRGQSRTVAKPSHPRPSRPLAW